MKISQWGLFALAIVIIESAFVPVAIETGGLQIGVVPLLFYTMLIGSVVGAFASYMDDKFRGFLSLFSRKMFLPMLTAGLLGYAVTLLLQNIGTIGTNPSISAIVWRSWIIMLAVLTPITLRQRVTKREFLGIGIGFISLYIVMTGGQLIGISAQEIPFIMILLLSGLAVTMSTLMLKMYNASTTGFNLLATLSSLLFTGILVFFYHANISISFSTSTLLSLVVLGVMDTGLAAILYYEVFKTFTNAFVSSFFLTVPFLTILLSSLLLHTPIEGYYIVAAVLLSIAILIISKDASKAPEYLKSKGIMEQMQIFDITSAFVNNRDPTINSYTTGSRRALAIKLSEKKFNNVEHRPIFQKRDCLAFTTDAPHTGTSGEEMEFINDIMGVKNGESVLVGMGETASIEGAFQDFVS